MKALKEVQTKLSFTNPKKSLLDYFFYQRVGFLEEETDNKLMVGIEPVALHEFVNS